MRAFFAAEPEEAQALREALGAATPPRRASSWGWRGP